MPHRSFTSLSPRSRTYFGLGIMANATLALYFADSIESGLAQVVGVDDANANAAKSVKSRNRNGEVKS
jgi:hypothetical protein